MLETTFLRRSFRDDADTMLRLATLVFVVALFVHGSDHVRRGIDASPMPVMVLGTVQTVMAVVTVALVIAQSRWAPIVAVAVGFQSAIGFVIVHVLPSWFGPFSDSLVHAPPDAHVLGFSWFAAIFEIVADVLLGIAGMGVLAARREARVFSSNVER